MKKHRRETAAILRRGRTISAELFQSAITSVRRMGEAAQEDADPTVKAITTRYRALTAAAQETAHAELVGVHRNSDDVQEFARFWTERVRRVHSAPQPARSSDERNSNSLNHRLPSDRKSTRLNS